MSVLVVGTIAFDSIKTPYSENPRLLGGSASHAAVAASFFGPTQLVGVVGGDFPAKYIDLFRRRRICVDGLQRVREGKTFHWSGEYEVNMNNRRTIETVLGVIDGWQPLLPGHYEATQHVLLANISPQVQLRVLDQLRKPRFVIADTMDLWINIALDDLLKVLKRVNALVLNDSEARQLVKEDNLVVALEKLHGLGPEYVIIKKGEHGALLSSPKGLFAAPAYPLKKLVDPTGAGDSFVGGLLGYLASRGRGTVDTHFRQAILHGSVVASYCCEGFGLKRTSRLTGDEIRRRARDLERIAGF